MTVNEIIAAMRLIQDMENDRIARNVIKDYSIESVTEPYGTSAKTVCVLVHEIAYINGSRFYFVDIEANTIYNAYHYVVFPRTPQDEE